MALGILVALSSIGLDFTRFALLASALGVGIGFDLQQLVSNSVAGLIILFEKSLKGVNFGDSSLDFELVVWLVSEAVKRPAAVQASHLWEIESKLREYDIEIPFPQRDVHLRSGLKRFEVKPLSHDDGADGNGFGRS